MRPLRALLAWSLALALAGCASPAAPPAVPVPETSEVKLVGSACGNCTQPSEVRIKAGERVLWTVDSGSHTVSFEHSPSGGPAPPDSGNLDVGQSYQLTFPNPGTFRYRCLYHSTAFGNAGEMVGSVVVS
jgi:plastocyanin